MSLLDPKKNVLLMVDKVKAFIKKLGIFQELKVVLKLVFLMYHTKPAYCLRVFIAGWLLSEYLTVVISISSTIKKKCTFIRNQMLNEKHSIKRLICSQNYNHLLG